MGRKYKKKTYVITSAQAYAKPNHNFLDSLEALVEREKAELIILPMIGKSGKEDIEEKNFAERIKEYGLFYDTSKKLNENISVGRFNIKPWQIDPIIGLDRFAQRETSIIFESPKQRWRTIPHSNRKIPRYLITTGAITLPNYANGMDVGSERRRLGNIALRDHEYGAIVVEVISNKYYFWRNIEALKNGKFVDLGYLYLKDRRGKVRIEETRPLASVLADWHNGYEIEELKKATIEFLKEYSPEKVILHDFFDGHSVSHHMEKRLISQMILEGVKKNNLSLEEELYKAGEALEELSNILGEQTKIYIVDSNHHDFLRRYLDEGRFITDPLNAELAFKLSSEYSRGKDPVKEGIRQVYGHIPKNVFFLKRCDDLKVSGYQLASHGDKGPGGGRNSIKSLEKDFGRSITGHVHKSEKLRKTHTVGTMTPLDIFYAKGQPISWTHTHANLYSTGVQAIHFIERKGKMIYKKKPKI